MRICEKVRDHHDDGSHNGETNDRSRQDLPSHYRTIADKYTGQVWNGLNSARLEGVASYNSYINSVPGVVWVIHPNWYVSAGYRKNNPGMLGRSLGCITLDPEVNNAIVNRLGNGALIYVTVGDDPVERYL
jgi:hypothetical protein